MPIRYLVAEVLKLRRSLAFLLCLAAPACVAFLGGVIVLDRPSQWPMFALNGVALWSFAMLPLAVTALSVLLAQSEHGPKTWNHILALPGARPWVFVAKALVMLGCVAAMMALLLVMLPLVGWLATLIRPDALTGTLDLAQIARFLSLMFLAAILVSILQLWVALRFKSFVPPLIFGLAGTLAAVGATSARQGIYFPWLLATNVLSTPERTQFAVLLGGLGGLVAFAAMLVHLSRREA